MELVPCRHADDDTPCPACSEIVLRTDGLEACFHSLRELVDAMAVRTMNFAVITFDHPQRYTQVLADEDGALLVEASSNSATDDGETSAALTVADERELRRLHYHPPDAFSPNWHRVFDDPWPWPAPVVAELLLRTLLDGLGAQVRDLHAYSQHATGGFGQSVPSGR